MPEQATEKVLTVDQVARRLGVSRHRVYQLLAETPARFPRASRFGEGEWIWQIPEGDVESYKAARDLDRVHKGDDEAGE